MFGRHNSYGHLVGSLSCGIFTGIADLWAHEGTEVVCEALESIWPDPMCRPDLLFYDLGCRMRPHRLLHPAPGWLHTRYIVDRCEGVATCRPTRTIFWVVGCSGNTRIRRRYTDAPVIALHVPLPIRVQTQPYAPLYDCSYNKQTLVTIYALM